MMWTGLDANPTLTASCEYIKWKWKKKQLGIANSIRNAINLLLFTSNKIGN